MSAPIGCRIAGGKRLIQGFKGVSEAPLSAERHAQRV
jgi:hypothetical protein